jgi:hypothetical protein
VKVDERGKSKGKKKEKEIFGLIEALIMILSIIQYH